MSPADNLAAPGPENAPHASLGPSLRCLSRWGRSIAVATGKAGLPALAVAWLLVLPVTSPQYAVVHTERVAVQYVTGWRWESGVASWYGPGFHGRRTSSGEIYDLAAWTLACRHLPLGTWVAVRNPANGRIAFARVTDRGPYIDGRRYDLSWALAEHLGLVREGVAEVEVAVLSGPQEADGIA